MKSHLDLFSLYTKELREFANRNKWVMEQLADDYEHKPLYYIVDTRKDSDINTVTLMLICATNFNLEKDLKYLTEKYTSKLTQNITGRKNIKYVIIYGGETQTIECGRLISKKKVNLLNVSESLKELKKYS